MNASVLLELLGARHSSDVFVHECKNGPTHGANHSRLDAWVMAKSWTNPVCWGYEIKVSRSDFVQDDKWRAYLPMCNQLYFVCPAGLIQPSEVPEVAGLMWAAKTGTRLYTKRKAPFRETMVDIENVFRYVLMCRAKITREYYRTDSKEYWEQWLASRKIDYEFGARVGKAIGKRIKDEIEEVRKANDRLERNIEALNSVKEILAEFGLDPNKGIWAIRQKIEEALSGQPRSLSFDLERAEDAIKRARESLMTWTKAGAGIITDERKQ